MFQKIYILEILDLIENFWDTAKQSSIVGD